METFNISPAKKYDYATPDVHGKTPIPPEQFTPQSQGRSTDISIFKPPPDPDKLNKRRRTKVLNEDEYVEKVGKIIERDFFPELEKIKAQSEYIDASDRQDTATMRRLEEQYSSRRPTPSSEIDRLQSPATFETPLEMQRDSEDREKINMESVGNTFSPANSWNATPCRSKNVESHQNSTKPLTSEKTDSSSDIRFSSNIRLDKFLAVHTSEDNESFTELMEEQQKEFKRAHEWMFKKDEQLSIESKEAQLALPSPESQADQRPNKGSNKVVEGWTYKNVNAVFYNPDGAPLTDAEKVELAKKERKIILENTRFTANPWKKDVQSANVKETAIAKQNSKLGKVGADGKELVDGNVTPSVGGYKLLRMGADATPQVNPDESPLMTWGEVDSTPYRLEGCQTPLLASGKVADGVPAFTMQQVPKRDRLALQLAEKNSKFYRDKKGQAIYKARCNIRTPKSVGNLGSMTPGKRLSTLSPAAQRLASSKLGIRIGTDKYLSNYNSPAHKGAFSSHGKRTPSIVSTPKGMKKVVYLV